MIKKQTPREFHINVDVIERDVVIDGKTIQMWSVNGYNLKKDLATHGFFTTKERALDEAIKLIK